MNWFRSPRIAILLQCDNDLATPRLSPLTTAIATLVKAQGVSVDLLAFGNDAIDIRKISPHYNLYVLKEKTAFNLSLAGALALGGAKIINSARSSQLARDKIAATALVAACGVPVPASWATGKPQALTAVAEYGPLWLKSPGGSRGAGVRRIADPYALQHEAEPADRYGLPMPFFAQREVPGDGEDLKVYVVGQKVWGLRRRFPAVTLEQKMGKQVLVPPTIKEAALACGSALGLELYGVDFLVSGSRFYVVDVNAFPGYKGIAEAPCAIAEYIYRSAQGCSHDVPVTDMTT